MLEVDISPRVGLSVDVALKPVSGSVIGTSATALARRATSVSSARPPVVTAIRNVTVSAVTATASAAAPAPVTGGLSFVAAPRAISVASAKPPVISVDATVNAVAATSTAAAVAPSTSSSNSVSGSVTAVKAGASANALIPVVEGEAVLTGGGPGTASALARPPVVSVVTTTSPVFASAGANLLFSNSTAANVPVPAGVVGVPSEIIIVPLYVENVQAVTPPAGFVYEAGDQIGADVQGYRVYYFWKRPTAADTGTYNFTIAAGLTGRSGFAVRFTGCVTSGSPFGDHATAVDTDATTTTTPTMSLTIGGTNRLALWSSSNFAGNGVTPPAGFTERADNGELSLATADFPAGGPTGNLTGTTPTATQSVGWLVTLLPT